MSLEVGDCYYQHFDIKTQLVVELYGQITTKQIRKIEAETGTQLQKVMLNYKVVDDSTHIDLVFVR